MPPVSVFISCVSDEFKPQRELLAQRLRTIGATVYDQETLQNIGQRLDLTLADMIDQSKYVIHLIGETPGGVPKRSVVDAFLADPRFSELPAVWKGCDPPPDRYALSYTQWEYWLGMFRKKRVLVYSMYAGKAPADGSQLAHLQAVRCGGLVRDRPTGGDWHLVSLVQGSLINLSGRERAAQVTPAEDDSPVVVLQLATTSTGYRLEGALRWRGECASLGKPIEGAATRGQLAARLAQPFTDLLDRASWVLAEERPEPLRVVELVLPRELLFIPLSDWEHYLDGNEFNSQPICRTYPVRLRVAGRGQTARATVTRRRERLNNNRSRLDRVGFDVPHTHRCPDALPCAVVHDETDDRWWEHESAVCGAFTRPPLSHAVKAKPPRTLLPADRAVEHGVPFLVWPEGHQPTPAALAGELEKATEGPERFCYYFRGTKYAVLAEGDGPPIPAASPMASKVPTHEGVR